jgi:hypothetical protein
MQFDELKEKLNQFRNREIVMFQILDAVEQYCKSQHDGKPLVGSSGAGFPDEDDEDYYQPEPECQICGKVDGHHRGCPEDDSPFALLERRGFD